MLCVLCVLCMFCLSGVCLGKRFGIGIRVGAATVNITVRKQQGMRCVILPVQHSAFFDDGPRSLFSLLYLEELQRLLDAALLTPDQGLDVDGVLALTARLLQCLLDHAQTLHATDIEYESIKW